MATTIQTKETINPNGKRQKVAFIPAFLEDNPVGQSRDPDYENRLMARDEKTALALRYGRWDVFGGQMFSEFAPDTHICKPFEIARHWTRWRAVDWGFAAPWCCLWFAKDPDTKRVYVYREAYEVGLTDPLQAEKIIDLSGGESCAFTYADPSMWTKRTTEVIAKSTYEAYLAGGVLLTKADNDQRSKISKTHSALANTHDGRPAVLIFDVCPNLIRTLPALVFDPKSPEAMQENQEDHAWDAFAYGLTNWAAPQVPRGSAKKPQQSPLMGVKGM